LKFKDKLKFYVITDSNYSDEAISVEESLKGGATSIQLRMKTSSTRNMIEVGNKLRKLTSEYDALFFVNDRLDVAQAVNADGIHVGASAYNLDEMKTAESEGADYLGVGAVYSTNTKLDARDLGINGLKNILKIANLPIVAIGGINHSNVENVLKCGVSGVAVVSAIVGAENILKSAENMNELIKKYIK
jgi:thiamine-phosphate pyrophosphorylase